MVEMTETARILNTATPRSLVILDEIGRGTSTYDGVSLAWAIIEYLHDRVGCRTLFATHYHELTDLTETLPRMLNLNVDVKEWQEKIVFLHKIVPGAADKSYGIHVAELAGVPSTVNRRAKEILAQLESQHVGGDAHKSISPRRKSGSSGEFQLTLFGFEEHPLLDQLRDFDVDSTSPIEALSRIRAWQEELLGETSQKPR
jgi:DNA mismatch repair protein MutS